MCVHIVKKIVNKLKYKFSIFLSNKKRTIANKKLQMKK